MADPSRIVLGRLAVSAESTPGTLSAGVYTNVPFFTTGFSMKPTKQFIDAPVVDATRQKTTAVGGSQQSDITISTGFSNEPGIRFLLESALFSTFSTNTIISAATAKFFSSEAKNELGATDRYRRVAGCLVSGFRLNMPSQGFVQADWRILGQAFSLLTTEAGSSYTTVTGLEPMASTLTGTSVTYNGSPLPGVTGFSLDFNNDISAQFAMGSTSPDHLTFGNFSLTGSGSYYTRDDVIATPFTTEVADDLVIVLKSSDVSPILNTCTITIPKVKFTGFDHSPEGLTLADKFELIGTYDAGIASKIQVVFTAV